MVLVCLSAAGYNSIAHRVQDERISVGLHLVPGSFLSHKNSEVEFPLFT